MLWYSAGASQVWLGVDPAQPYNDPTLTRTRLDLILLNRQLYVPQEICASKPAQTLG